MHKEGGLRHRTLRDRVARERQVPESIPMELGLLADQLKFKVMGTRRNRHPGLCCRISY